MANRTRPRLAKAAPRDVDRNAAVAAVQAQLWAKLPAITKEAIALGLAGNTAVLGKLLDLVRDLLKESAGDKGNDILDKITILRQGSLAQVLDGQAGQPTNLGSAGLDGPVHADAGGTPPDVVPDVDPAIPDL